MVKGALVDRYLRAGTRLVELLDAAGVQTSGALWLYNAEFERWRLIFALPAADRSGPRAAYRQIGDVFDQSASELQPLEFGDITVKGPNESPFALLRGVVNPVNAQSPIHFAGPIYGAKGGVLNVDDSWIYRAS